MIETIITGTGAIRDRYTIETGDLGIYVTHDTVDETGVTELASMALLLIDQEAMPQVSRAIQRAVREFANV